MITPLFEEAFLKAVQKHSSIKKQLKKKVDMILKNPIYKPSRAGQPFLNERLTTTFHSAFLIEAPRGR